VSATVINSYAFFQERIVNGNFANLTGMTNNVASWWGRAVPFGWGTFVNVSTNDLLVRGYTPQTGPVFYANLQGLTRSPQEAGGLLPFFQEFTMPATSDFILSWNGSNPFNGNAWAMAANIFNRTTGQQLAVQPAFNTPQTVTLTASNVPAGHVVRINFWKGAAAQTPGLSNVSVIF
jgi:hypothetical protein